MTRGRITCVYMTFVAAMLVVLAGSTDLPLKVVYNASASTPLGWYAIDDTNDIAVGDLVVVRPPLRTETLMVERNYIARGVPLVKFVMAMAGARICRDGDQVTIDARAVGDALDRDSHARPLPRWSGCHVLTPRRNLPLQRRRTRLVRWPLFRPHARRRHHRKGATAMDLVRLSITGGFALASVLTLLALARHGAADPLAHPAISAPVFARELSVVSSPVLVDPAAPTPVVRVSNDPAYGGLFPLPVALASTNPATFGERWRCGPTVWSAYVEEASHRFGVPPAWIRSVMQAESGSQQFLNGLPITSPKGAMGLMQVMPQTYGALRMRYGLGPDPYDPRDNILAGTAYIREMYDRFGAPGFLAAYNAGPGRANDMLARGRPLPDETRRYLAEVAPRLAQAPSDARHAGVVRVAEPVQDLTGPALLSARATASIRAPISPIQAPLFVTSKARASAQSEQANTPGNDGLFVVLGGTDRRRLSAMDDTSGN